MSDRTKPSKQIGSTISRLIGIAQTIKHDQQPVREEAEDKRTDWQFWRAEAQRWRGIAQSNAQKLKQTRFETLANYPLEDIEKELLRRQKERIRKESARTSNTQWPADIDKSRRRW